MKITTPVISVLAALLLSGNVVAQQPDAAAPAVSSVNTFNRLMKPKMKVNPPPMEDEIHDAENPGTTLLQPPKAAFDSLDKSTHGNNVNWVSSLENGKLNPRWDRIDDTMQPIVFDLNIVREVKGSMPNVVYPHKQHTEWLDCSNCHPDIFIPQKGANQINMASILLGEKCGVCHGKVAFPVTTSTCRLCHSQNKENANLKRSDASLPQ
jgi:c(7)-type cytochrome triheme protein